MSDWLRLPYEQYRQILRDEPLPAVLVNLDAFDQNVETILSWVRGTGKTLRIATKSVRVPHLLTYLKDRCGDLYGGLMCYTVPEARFLSDLGFDDLLIAYPTVQVTDLEILGELAAQGKTVRLIVDSDAHINALSFAGLAAGATIEVVVDVDVSYRPGKGKTHLGVRRSPIRDGFRVLELIRQADRLGGVRVVGMMAYEAQIAGLTDANPFTRTFNPVKRLVKRLSIPDVARLRQEVAELLRINGVQLPLFNGGGTGSLKTTSLEDPITEVTAGSGFYCSHLFSYYRKMPLVPAAFFALQVVRTPAPGMVTCHGGGYVASGEIGKDRLPVPHSPAGLRLIDREGAGEVQTPLTLCRRTPDLAPGDPVIFRHAKAGELAEHFNEFILVREGKIEDRTPTYRGLNKAFL